MFTFHSVFAKQIKPGQSLIAGHFGAVNHLFQAKTTSSISVMNWTISCG